MPQTPPPFPNSPPPNPDYQDSTVKVFKCRIIDQGDLEIQPVKPQGKVWVGVNDIRRSKDYHTAIIKRVIRSAKAYQGGGSYGTFGGYDITLIELTEAVPQTYGKPACLPTVSFKDTYIKADLAGYGQFYRRDMSGDEVQICLTDQYGRNKYHPCAASGNGDKVCHTKQPPPQTAACQAFFNQTAIRYPEEYEEIQLVDKAGATISFCFDTTSPVPTSKGWCETDANYYNFKEVKEAGWGFCSADCFLGDIQARVSATRIADFRELNNATMILRSRTFSFCNFFLKNSVFLQK